MSAVYFQAFQNIKKPDVLLLYIFVNYVQIFETPFCGVEIRTPAVIMFKVYFLHFIYLYSEPFLFLVKQPSDSTQGCQ